MNNDIGTFLYVVFFFNRNLARMGLISGDFVYKAVVIKYNVTVK